MFTLRQENKQATKLQGNKNAQHQQPLKGNTTRRIIPTPSGRERQEFFIRSKNANLYIYFNVYLFFICI
jgi:hypothetical protein